MGAEGNPIVPFTIRLRNGLIIAVLLIGPWVFASIHLKTQIFLKILLTVLACTLLVCPRSAPSRRDFILASMTIGLLAFGLVSVFNQSIRFLPMSIDPVQSAFTLWGATGLAALFWSVRDCVADDPGARRKLIWIILVNGALLVVVSLLQRVTDPYKVLWTYRPAVTNFFYVFGPFEYRATASQFFNILWPVALGLYLDDKISKPERRHFPLPLVAILIAAPLITSSRGGIVMGAFAGTLFVAGLLTAGKLSRPIRSRLFLIAVGAGIVFLFFGIKPLQRRLAEAPTLGKILDLQGRLVQNQNSWRMIADHPLWGVGPGAYETAFRSYNFKNAFKPARDDPQEKAAWDFFYAKAHNDWLQTLAEWGFPATAVLALTILLAWVQLLARPTAEPILNFGIAISILTLLLHGAFDYPLQNLAILIYVTTLLAFGKRNPLIPAPIDEGQSLDSQLGEQKRLAD